MWRRFVCLRVPGLITFAVCLAITRSSTAQQTKPASAAPLFDRLDELYNDYIRGDVGQARESLQKGIQLIETSSEGKPAHRAHALWLGYGRLSVLEHRTGNDSVSEAYMLKSRYWLLQRELLNGEPLEDASKYVMKSMTPEHVTKLVLEWDEKHTAGKGPRYVQVITSATTMPSVPASR